MLDDKSSITNQSPAEALRQQILKAAQENFDNGEYIVDGQDWRRFLDDAIKLVTAYAATVEREGRIDELQNLYVDFDEKKLRRIEGTKLVTIDARLAALQGPLDDSTEGGA